MELEMQSLYTDICLDLTKWGIHFNYAPHFAAMQSITGRRGRLICADKRVGGTLSGPSLWLHLGKDQAYFGLWNPRLYRAECNESVAQVVRELLRGQPPFKGPSSKALIHKYEFVELDAG